MALTVGTRLGPYEIVAPLGAGGMGEVYRARDSRLGRDVAVKALPEGFDRDPGRVARFEREAKLLASLSHANIAGIHGLEEHAGQRYLILEFVDGETLAERLRRGALPLDEAIEVARHIAMALEAAHESGVVHRDLKPGNVMITHGGVVKVLDFGLAKSAAPAGSSSSLDLSASPTMTHVATAAGIILGTAAYMSPEQARGKNVDRRTDIWSFGCVLFECLTGRPMFEGETVSDIVARILQSEPEWSALPAGTPMALRRLLERCLRKDARERLRDIGDARIELGEIRGGAPDPPPVAARRAGWAMPALLVVATAGLVFVATWGALRRPAPASGVLETSVMLPPGQRLARSGDHHMLALSPDGRAVAFMARVAGTEQLHIRRLDRREDTTIPGTSVARDLFFSPDGEWIAYFDSQHLLKVSVHGGPPSPLATSTQDRGGVWLDDGTIVFTPDADKPLFKLPRSGGVPVAITQLDSTRKERTHRWPSALAGGPWVVFTVGSKDSPDDYDAAEIDAVSITTGERRTLVHGARRAVWLAPNHLVFDRQGTLFAVPIDPHDPRIKEDAVPVLDHVAGVLASGASYLDASRDGTLAWVQAEGDRSREIGWFDRSGHWARTPIPPARYDFLSVSPDGSRALLVIAGNVWLGDLASGATQQLTYTLDTNGAMWLPDGSGFMFSSPDSTGGSQLGSRRLDGVGGIRFLRQLSGVDVATGVTSDGAGIVYGDWGTANGRLHVDYAASDGHVEDLPTEANAVTYEAAGALSPDGRLLAFVSNRTGREEVFIRRRDGTGGQWQVSTEGGGGLRWGRGGSELFFVENELLKSVSVRVNGTELALGKPATLFEVPASPIEETYRDYDYDARNDRFYFTRPPEGTDERREIALSIGWGARLAELIRAQRERR